jgi:type I restriction enzyme R subunit
MSKTTNTKESGLEQHITDYLVSANGYVLRTSQDYDNVNCVDTDLLFQFLETTQPKAVEKLKRYHKDLYKQKIVKRINDQIKQKGIIEVLRKGV